MTEEAVSGAVGEAGQVAPELPKIFLNYRRAESAGDARLLYERLATRFGSDNVFLDVVNLAGGVNWFKEIQTHDASSGVFLALIGQGWIRTIAQRMAAAVSDQVEDVVAREIEVALARGSGVGVLPVLIDGAPMPSREELPRSIRALADIQAVSLRHAQFDQDFESMAKAIEEMARRPKPAPPPWIADPVDHAAVPVDHAAVPVTSPAATPTSAPDGRHYQRVAEQLVDEGTVVILLGPRVGASYTEAGWAPDVPRVPGADEIAADLTRRFHLDPTPEDLAQAAQQVYVTSGESDLYRRLRQLLRAEAEPSPVHRFFAQLPSEAQQADRAQRYALIVTTGYDTALERAFDDANEPYDLVVYMAAGKHRGRFVHFPYQGAPQPIETGNDYGEFPIDDDGSLSRCIIVKIHGAVDGNQGNFSWRDNYVVTEDQYIDYLSRTPVEDVIPVQILDKLKQSHWLFLGYTMRDWNLRVFLNRIWEGETLDARSWAIEPADDDFEREFWSRFGVDMFSCRLVDYLAELSRHVGQPASGSG